MEPDTFPDQCGLIHRYCNLSSFRFSYANDKCRQLAVLMQFGFIKIGDLDHEQDVMTLITPVRYPQK
jgi:hypothetical protein